MVDFDWSIWAQACGSKSTILARGSLWSVGRAGRPVRGTLVFTTASLREAKSPTFTWVFPMLFHPSGGGILIRRGFAKCFAIEESAASMPDGLSIGVNHCGGGITADWV